MTSVATLPTTAKESVLAASHTDMTAVSAAAAASVPVNDLTNCVFPGYNHQEVFLASAPHGNAVECSNSEVEMFTSGEGSSSPTSPSEGSESLGSHSQTEVASVIERGDTATPDTHSDAQDPDNSCSESQPDADERGLPSAQEKPATSD